MNKIKLISITLKNFKGTSNRTVDFGNVTTITGRNASGKTTIADAFMWVLFNKNYTGDTKFSVRPQDENNKVIDHIDIVVTLKLDINGKIVEIEKTQKQNWVNRRGSAETELKGNDNSFNVNSVPMKENEYKKYIEEIIPEDLFKLLTNPTNFTSRKWQEQRKVLIEMVGNIDNEDIFNLDKTHQFDTLKALLSIYSYEESVAITKDKANSLSKEKQEIPIRIDTLNSQKKDVDIAELELKKNAISDEIQECEKQLDDMAENIKKYESMSDELMKAKFDMNDISRKMTSEHIGKKKDIQGNIDSLKDKLTKSHSRIAELNKFISETDAAIPRFEKDRKDLASQWKAYKSEKFDESAWVLPEDSLVCSLCGQSLPEDKKSEVIAKFEERKANARNQFDIQKKIRLDNTTKDGNFILEQLKEQTKAKTSAMEEIERISAEVKTDTDKLDVLDKELSEFPTSIDFNQNSDYVAFSNKVAEIEKELSAMNNSSELRTSLKIRLKGLNENLQTVNSDIAKADNSDIENAIDELENHLKEVSQLLADQENIKNSLDMFNRQKMKMISDRVNKKFGIVSWKLFDMQLNGGVAETCQCLIGGIAYPDLNSGHKIVAGLDIINTLIGMHEISCPIFVDNAESINDENIPEIDAQMILLKVGANADIEVEKE